MGMKQKRFLIQVHLPFRGWITKNSFNEFNSAIQSCENLYKKFDKESNTRVFDTVTNERVYPYQKDKTGKEIIPKI